MNSFLVQGLRSLLFSTLDSLLLCGIDSLLGIFVTRRLPVSQNEYDGFLFEL